MIEFYKEIINVVGLGMLIGILFIFDPYVRLVDKHLPFKPFNCVLCTSFWFSIVVYTLIGYTPVYAIYTAMISEAIYRKLVE